MTESKKAAAEREADEAAEAAADADPRIGEHVGVGVDTVTFPDGTEYNVDPATGAVTERRGA